MKKVYTLPKVSTQQNIDLQKKKLFIFDLDGTLIDSSLDICTTIVMACEKLDLATPQLDEIKGYLHQGSQQILQDLFKDKALVKKIYPHFIRLYEQNMLIHTKLYTNIDQSLAKIVGYAKIALMSNKREQPCVKILKGLNIEHYFDQIVGGDTFPVKKPNPLPLMNICKNLNISPADTVMIGDSPVDIEAAKNAQISSLAVLSGFTEKHRVLAAQPDMYLNHVSELINYI